MGDHTIDRHGDRRVAKPAVETYAVSDANGFAGRSGPLNIERLREQRAPAHEPQKPDEYIAASDSTPRTRVASDESSAPT